MRDKKLKHDPNKLVALMVGRGSDPGKPHLLDGVVLPIKEQVHSLGVLLDSGPLFNK